MTHQLVPVIKACTIIVYSHFFKIAEPSYKILNFLHRFALKFAVKDFTTRNPNTKPEPRIVCIYAVKTKDGYEQRFHIGQLPLFLEELKNHFIYEDEYEIIRQPLYEPTTIEIALKEGWTLRDYQLEAKGFMLAKLIGDHNSKLVTMPMGTGKTVTALATIADIKQRVAIVILSSYMEKWVADVQGCTNTDPSEIITISGSDQLKGLIDLAKSGNYQSKFVIFSLTTLQNFYKLYEANNGDIELDGYDCKPEQLFELLGIGVLLIDEAHQHLHATYKLFNYTHVPLVLALSATYMASDFITTKIQKLMFPQEMRFDKIKMKKYIKVHSIAYAFRDLNNSKIRTREYGATTYSHVAFEKSVLKHLPTLKNYLKLICDMVRSAYVREYQSGDKLIVFASTIKMCDKIAECLKKEFPEYDVRRYVEKDPYENVIDADIRVTTIKSAGTAIDIPGLRATLMTDSVDSEKSNLQVLGRLRELKDRDVKFYYVFCEQIPKHVKYHKKKIEIFRERVLSINEMRYPHAL